MKKDDGLPASSFAAAKRVATRNILNPLLWLCGIIVLPFIVLAVAYPENNLQPILVGSALALLALTVVAYIYWTFRDPDRLQSEEFVLQQRWMDHNATIGDNRTSEVIDVGPAREALSANSSAVDRAGV